MMFYVVLVMYLLCNVLTMWYVLDTTNDQYWIWCIYGIDIGVFMVLDLPICSIGYNASVVLDMVNLRY